MHAFDYIYKDSAMKKDCRIKALKNTFKKGKCMNLKNHTKLSEEETIKNDPELVESLKQGSKDAKNKKGRFID